jgi:hypothetical protein
VRSLTHLLERLSRFKDLVNEVLDIRNRATKVSRQLHGWCNSLQNTDIKGQRYLTDKSRRLDAAKKDREERKKEWDQYRYKGNVNSTKVILRLNDCEI